MPDSENSGETPEAVAEFLRVLQDHARRSGLTRPVLAREAAALERARYRGHLPPGRQAWIGHNKDGVYAERRLSAELTGLDRFPRWELVLAVAHAYADHNQETRGEVVARLETLHTAAVRAREAGKAATREKSPEGLPSWPEYNAVRGERDQAQEAARVANVQRDDARDEADTAAHERDTAVRERALAVEGRDEARADRDRDRARLEVLQQSFVSLAAAVSAASAAATTEHQRELEHQQQRVDELDAQLGVLRRELAEGQRARAAAELAASDAQARAAAETRRADAQERRAGALRAEADRLAGDVEQLQRQLAQHGPLREDPGPESPESPLTSDDAGPETSDSSGVDTGVGGIADPDAPVVGLLSNRPRGESELGTSTVPPWRRAGKAGASRPEPARFASTVPPWRRAEGKTGPSSAASAPMGPPSSVGEGRYTLGDRLGSDSHGSRGGDRGGEVFRARDERLGRDVAVRFFPNEAVGWGVPAPSGAWKARRRRQREALYADWSHPGVVTIYDEGQESGRGYVVMQLIEGGTLTERLRSGPLALADIFALGATLFDALHYLHGHGLVHRGIEPGHILLGRDGRPYLSDYGSSATADHTRIPSAGAGGTYADPGTTAYLSPEQVRGQPATAASDVYSLGLVLLEAVTGRSEYPGAALEAATARLHRTPEIPPDLGTLGALLADMTRDEPAARFPSDVLGNGLRMLHTTPSLCFPRARPVVHGGLDEPATSTAATAEPATAASPASPVSPSNSVRAAGEAPSPNRTAGDEQGHQESAGRAGSPPRWRSDWGVPEWGVPTPSATPPSPSPWFTSPSLPARAGDVANGPFPAPRAARPARPTTQLVAGVADGDVEPIISDILSGRFVPARDHDRYRPFHDTVVHVCAAALEGGVLLPGHRRSWVSGVSSRGTARSGLTLFLVTIAALAGIAALVLHSATGLRAGLLDTVTWSAWPAPLLTLAGITVAGYIAPLRRLLPATLLLATTATVLTLGLSWSGPPWGAGDLTLAALVAAAGAVVSVAVGRWRRAEMFYDEVADYRARHWGDLGPALRARLGGGRPDRDPRL